MRHLFRAAAATLLLFASEASPAQNLPEEAQLAAFEGDTAVLETLLKKNPALAKAADNAGNTLLHLAPAQLQLRGDAAPILVLLRYGADPQRKNKAGTKPVDVLYAMADADEIGMSILHKMAVQGNLKAVKALLAIGFDPSFLIKKDGSLKGLTPLMCAAGAGHLAIARALVEAGADVTAKTADGKTALGFAEAKGHLELLKYLKTHSK